MIRFAGQTINPGKRVAIIANDAIGNFVMATPLAQLARSEWKPSELVYFGGTRTAELQAGSRLYDSSENLHGLSSAQFAALSLKYGGYFDIVVNLESTSLAKTFCYTISSADTLVMGPSVGEGGRGDLEFPKDEYGDLWRDQDWISNDLNSRYTFLRSGFISDVFARLCHFEGDLPSYSLPVEPVGVDVPELLISTAASLTTKLWPDEKWEQTIGELKRRGHSIGILGAAPKDQSQFWQGGGVEDRLIGKGLAEDLRGRFTLPQVSGALAKARCSLTIDNGILHLAVASGTRTTGLYRHGIHRLWAPPYPNLTVIVPDEGSPVSSIEVDHVLKAVEGALEVTARLA